MKDSLIVVEAYAFSSPARYVALKDDWLHAPRVGDQLDLETAGATMVMVESVGWTRDGVAVVRCSIARHTKKDIEALRTWGFERKDRPTDSKETP